MLGGCFRLLDPVVAEICDVLMGCVGGVPCTAMALSAEVPGFIVVLMSSVWISGWIFDPGQWLPETLRGHMVVSLSGVVLRGFGGTCHESGNDVLVRDKGRVDSLQILVIRSRGIPLLGLFLDVFDFDDFSTKSQTCEATFAAKVVLLFRISKCFVEVVVGNGFKLLKKVWQ